MLELVVTLSVAALTALLLVPDVIALAGFRQRAGSEGMVGARGEVLEEVGDAGGWVQVRGERWRARRAESSLLLAGERVEVVAVEGLTALVRAAGPEPQLAPSRSWAAEHPVRATCIALVVLGGSGVLAVYSSPMTAILPFIGAGATAAFIELDL